MRGVGVCLAYRDAAGDAEGDDAAPGEVPTVELLCEGPVHQQARQLRVLFHHRVSEGWMDKLGKAIDSAHDCLH